MNSKILIVDKETKTIFESLELGSINHINKSVDFEDLLKTIKKYVEN